MKLLRLLALSALLGLFAAAPASAQYIYMDSNGDGVHTAADVMNANGTATTVDFWLNTAHNKDGSLAICDTGDGNLDTWNSYAIHVNVLNGTATFTGFVNQQTAFVTGCADAGNVFFKTDNATIMSACAATGTPTANAGVNLKMCTVTVTGATGSPSLVYVPSNSLDQNFTSFGTPCSGHDFDNTYKLGPLPGGAGPGDFTDNDGIGAAAGGNSPPTITAPATATGTENQAFTVSATATDTDAADILTITATGQPADLTFSSTPHVSPATATISGTPGFADQGSYSIVWSVSDGHNAAVTATTALTINNVDRPPVVTAPATESVAAGNPLQFTITASDPDAESILALTAAGTAVTAGGTFTPNATHTSGTFDWTPTAGQTGTFDVTFTATNSLTGTATTQITVTGGAADQPPVVTAPATMTGSENNLLTFTVTANDPDGQAITSLTAAPLPSGATFTANGTNTAGTFSWTPSFTQAGSYSVTFTASNALSGTATTAITISNTDRAPVVTAPSSESGTEGTLLTFTVTASDADGEAITSLMAAPLPTGATFTPNGTNTSGTFSWTPSTGQAGTYDVTFTASNALSGSATTHITITAQGADHPPVVTAPATETVDEGQLLTFTVSATDQDGDHVTLTAAGVPSGATFTDNANNTGTFTWTPNFSQSGTYTVTFTGNDGHGGTGTATTVITVNNVNTGGGGTATATLIGNFNSHRRFLCFHVSPTNGSFDVHNVDLGSVTLNFGGSSITAAAAQTHVEADCDSEDVESCDGCREQDTGARHIESHRAAAQCDTTLQVCFLMSDVVGLFGSQSIPGNLANATITGNLTTGGTFTATIAAPRVAGRDDSGDAKLHSRAKPNPLNPKTDLTFTLAQSGLVRVSVFDAQGRLVKTLLNETRPAGENVVAWDGSDAKGGHVASGVFFFRVEALGAQDIVRVTVLK